MIDKIFFLFLFFVNVQLLEGKVETDVLVYSNAVQVNSEINEYENLVAGKLVVGSIMITHDPSATVDIKSFSMGGKPLQVELLQGVNMTSYGSLMVSVYQFQLEGMKAGNYTLPPIKVKVGGNEYQAQPLTFQVGN